MSVTNFIKQFTRLMRHNYLFFLVYADTKVTSYRKRLRAKYYGALIRGRCHSVGSKLLVEDRPSIRGEGRVDIGNHLIFRGKVNVVATAHIFEDSCLSIGDRTHVGDGVHIRCAKRVTIGANCLIARDVRIFDYNGHPLDPEARLQRRPCPKSEVSPVSIGNNVWIGDCSVITKGVNIGDNAVVGANSVVIKDVPANTVVLGIPARVILWLDKIDEANRGNVS